MHRCLGKLVESIKFLQSKRDPPSKLKIIHLYFLYVRKKLRQVKVHDQFQKKINYNIKYIAKYLCTLFSFFFFFCLSS